MVCCIIRRPVLVGRRDQLGVSLGTEGAMLVQSKRHVARVEGHWANDAFGHASRTLGAKTCTELLAMAVVQPKCRGRKFAMLTAAPL
jgi:hypothetical protein